MNTIISNKLNNSFSNPNYWNGLSTHSERLSPKGPTATNNRVNNPFYASLYGGATSMSYVKPGDYYTSPDENSNNFSDLYGNGPNGISNNFSNLYSHGPEKYNAYDSYSYMDNYNSSYYNNDYYSDSVGRRPVANQADTTFSGPNGLSFTIGNASSETSTQLEKEIQASIGGNSNSGTTNGKTSKSSKHSVVSGSHGGSGVVSIHYCGWDLSIAMGLRLSQSMGPYGKWEVARVPRGMYDGMLFHEVSGLPSYDGIPSGTPSSPGIQRVLPGL